MHAAGFPGGKRGGQREQDVLQSLRLVPVAGIFRLLRGERGRRAVVWLLPQVREETDADLPASDERAHVL